MKDIIEIHRSQLPENLIINKEYSPARDVTEFYIFFKKDKVRYGLIDKRENMFTFRACAPGALIPVFMAKEGR